MKRKRYTKAQMQDQLQMIEKLLTVKRLTASRLMRNTKLGKHALHNRLRILRNDGKVRYDQEGGTVFWSIGTMPALEAKPKDNSPKPDIMLKWGGWAP
jgi:hypothetical protein